MNKFVLSGLVKRRAELAGDIESTHEALRKILCGSPRCSGGALATLPEF